MIHAFVVVSRGCLNDGELLTACGEEDNAADKRKTSNVE